ncbi:ATP-binding protein [Roseateles sp. DC23W]|uniref:histidine kinase n=1 Tax=Pelomonas dachongensis TaxID=3299029 RepID=A0ABW7EU26_9BURK
MSGTHRRSMLGRARLMAKVLAVLLSLTVVAALALLARFERGETLGHAQGRAELIARTLEDHVTRTVESASLILRTLGEGIAQQGTLEPARLQPLLGQPLLSSLPFLRSAAVIDERGVVLASSIRGEPGLRIDMDGWGPLPAEGQEALLPLRPGRSLFDLATSGAPRAAGVGVLPLVRWVRGAAGQRVLLVALINPGALANFQQVAVSGDGGVALLASWQGRLVAANEPVALEPGQQISGHPVFDSWLPQREHGVYIGRGLLEGRQVVAFRASRTRPLVVLVELAQQAVLRPWHERVNLLGAVGLLALLAILGGLAVLLREMDAREHARAALDGAHEQVALRERELSVLLKSVQELIFRTDATGAITFVNARWVAISHEGPDHAIGQRLRDLVALPDRQRTDDLFTRDDRVGVRQEQLCLRAADGRLRHFLVAVVPLHGEGRIVGFAGSAVDVSERVLADQQLQRQLAFSALLLEMSPLPVSMFDTAGRYVLVNQAWEDFVGRPRASVIGTQVGAFLSAQDAELHAEQDARLLAHGGKARYETQVLHRDGSRRDMVLTKVVVPGDGGEPAGILCTLMDVSEFRDAERATREARDAAERASREKSAFVANISHELRTPLQAILGFSELGCVRGRDNARLAGMFNDIHHSGQRMLALVNDLLDVSKIESAVGTFELERCDLREIVQAVLREVDPLLAQRGLRVALTLADEPLIARLDPTRIHQAIRNVIANAIKFSPQDGALQVACLASESDTLTLTVADRGPGIPPGELESIFEAFVQSSRTQDGSGGTGLGLAICRKILDIHGGQIWADNRVGGGAVFTLVLPQRPSGDSQLHTGY